MTEPISYVTLGGLTYNANQATGRRLEDGNYELIFNTGEKLVYPEQTSFEVNSKSTTFSYYKDSDYHGPVIAQTGETVENVNFKPVKDAIKNRTPDGDYVLDDGISIPIARNAKVTQKVQDGWIYDDTSFDITNVMGATFTTSKDAVANVTLENCSGTTVNLGANESRWYADTATVSGGANNKVILDDEDTATINGHNVTGAGEASQKDYSEN